MSDTPWLRHREREDNGGWKTALAVSFLWLFITVVSAAVILSNRTITIKFDIAPGGVKVDNMNGGVK